VSGEETRENTVGHYTQPCLKQCIKWCQLEHTIGTTGIYPEC
ncbi:hypothetical protein TNCT_351141, partial [Trichonephila clavata]